MNSIFRILISMCILKSISGFTGKCNFLNCPINGNETHCLLSFEDSITKENTTIEFKEDNRLENVKVLSVKDLTVHYMPKILNIPLHSVRELSIIKTGLKQIQNEDLKDFKGLTKLNLSGNAIERLEKDLFNCLKMLMTINLSNNQINFIHPGTFVSLKNLNFLNLDHNTCISDIESTQAALKRFVDYVNVKCAGEGEREGRGVRMNNIENILIELQKSFENFTKYSMMHAKISEVQANFNQNMETLLNIVNKTKSYLSQDIRTKSKYCKNVNETISLIQNKVKSKNYVLTLNQQEMKIVIISAILMLLVFIIFCGCCCLCSKFKLKSNKSKISKEASTTYDACNESIKINEPKNDDGEEYATVMINDDQNIYEELPIESNNVEYCEVLKDEIQELPVYATVDLTKKSKKEII